MANPGPVPEGTTTFTARRTRTIENGRRRFVLNFSWANDSPSIIVSFPGTAGHDVIRVFDYATGNGVVTISTKEQFIGEVNEYMRTLLDEDLLAHWNHQHHTS